MANENMFIAAAIWLTGMLGFFVFLVWYLRSHLLKKAALIGCFGVLMVSMETLRWGWQHVVVATDMVGVAEVVYHVMTIGMTVTVIALTISVILDTVGYVVASAEGRRYDWEKEKLRGV